MFAEVPEARTRGYDAGRFSFNVKGGRCEACQGDGLIKVEMHFLPDVYVPCDVCKGQRYNRETLEIRWRGKNIHEVLADERRGSAAAVPERAGRGLAAADAHGRGAVAICSSGRAPRRCPAARPSASNSRANSPSAPPAALYTYLDEPTTGLHFHDVAQLLDVLHRLRDEGNTIVVIEHNLDVIKTADWIIDLGPDGGAGGGRVLVSGTPEEVARHPDSYTARYLEPLVGNA